MSPQETDCFWYSNPVISKDLPLTFPVLTVETLNSQTDTAAKNSGWSALGTVICLSSYWGSSRKKPSDWFRSFSSLDYHFKCTTKSGQFLHEEISTVTLGLSTGPRDGKCLPCLLQILPKGMLLVNKAPKRANFYLLCLSKVIVVDPKGLDARKHIYMKCALVVFWRLRSCFQSGQTESLGDCRMFIHIAENHCPCFFF